MQNNFNNDTILKPQKIENKNIYDRIRLIKSNAYGIDEINVVMKIIKHIFNASIQDDIFLKMWKS